MKRIPLVSLRLVRERGLPYGRLPLSDSRAVYTLFRDLAEDLDREAMWVACVDTKHRPTCVSQVSVGALNATLAIPRDILKIAVATSAQAVFLIHNHPSGDPAPSPEDRQVTKRVKEAAELLGLRLLDHLIIGDGAYYSFADHGGL